MAEIKESKEQVLPKKDELYAVKLNEKQYGLAWIIAANEKAFRDMDKNTVYVAPLNWIGQRMPTVKDAKESDFLYLNNFNYDGKPPAFNPKNNVAGGWIILQSKYKKYVHPEFLTLIGTMAAGKKEQETADRHLSIALTGWEDTRYTINNIWRWNNDRTKYVKELYEESKQPAEMQASEKKMPLSLSELKQKQPLAGWEKFVPEKTVNSARKIILGFASEIEKTASKEQIKALLEKAVSEFNKLDKENRHFIETTERDDICMQLKRLAEEKGLTQKETEALIDKTRDW